MRAFNVRGLSDLAVCKKLDSRFGLSGFARLVKLLELIADCPAADVDQPVTLSWGDVLECLQASDMVAVEFFAFCEDAKALRVTREEGRLLVTLADELGALMASAPVCHARRWFLSLRLPSSGQNGLGLT